MTVWLVRAGQHGERESLALEQEVSLIGWDELPDLTAMTSREELEGLMREVYPDAGDRTIRTNTTQVWAFRERIQVSDLVVLPLHQQSAIAIGKIVGAYAYRPDLPADARHTRATRWLKTDIPRSAFGPDLLHSLSANMTVCQISRNNAEERIQALIDTGGPTPEPPSARRFWVEKTYPATHATGEWAFGHGLWSPQQSKSGTKIYKEMLMLRPDDVVFHLDSTQHALVGVSLVAASAVSDEQTPENGPWSDSPSFRVALKGFTALKPALPTSAFLSHDHEAMLSEIDTQAADRRRATGAKQLFYERAEPGKPERLYKQGAYLTEAPPRLVRHMASTYRTLTGAVLPHAESVEAAGGPTALGTAFTSEAQGLLERFGADPTKAFYAANKDALTKYVQEPIQGLLLEVGERVAPQLRTVLETKRNLFSRFNKNDFGQGGAWPFYWGAFYPLGGKRTDGCQLFVSANAEGFSYGFAIGDYASEDRKRFGHSIEVNREALAAALCDTINTPDFGFGNENITLGGQLTKGIRELDLTGWLEEVGKIGPRVHVLLSWDELFGIERANLVENITNAFNRLFPLVLLCTSDNPMPDIQSYMEGEASEVNAPYSLDDLAEETSLPKENLEAWIRAIERKGQAILYGPPGTGKTYVAERLARHLVAGGTGTAELVQFHPAYAYEDFMQGMRPKARGGGGLDYPVVDGRFKQFCDQARNRTGLSVLIIDEINRANLARVFGELMYLLEYRDKSIPLSSGGYFSIPSNVRIIGTMNTADRSIALVDHALRRRFAFLPLYPDYQMLTDYHAKSGDGYDPAKLIDVLKDLNRKIGDHHYEVGTSFFMRPDIAEQLPDVWSMEIEPYLEEYFFDQQATVETFRWEAVKKKLGEE